MADQKRSEEETAAENVEPAGPPPEEDRPQKTGQKDPARIIPFYRDCGAPGLLGVKLGPRGALLSPAAGELIEIPPVEPPGEVVDTTGAGDTFYAGLLVGLADQLLLGLRVATPTDLAVAAIHTDHFKALGRFVVSS